MTLVDYLIQDGIFWDSVCLPSYRDGHATLRLYDTQMLNTVADAVRAEEGLAPLYGKDYIYAKGVYTFYIKLCQPKKKETVFVCDRLLFSLNGSRQPDDGLTYCIALMPAERRAIQQVLDKQLEKIGESCESLAAMAKLKSEQEGL